MRNRFLKFVLVLSGLGLLMPWHPAQAFLQFLNPNTQFALNLQLIVALIAGIIAFWQAALNYVVSDFVKLSFTSGGIVQVGWPIMRDLANLGFVFALVVIALATALRYKDYEAKKLLPGLVGAILLINFTPVIAGLILDPFNILMNFFLSRTSGLEVANLILQADVYNFLSLLDPTKIGGYIPFIGNLDLIIQASIMIFIGSLYVAILFVFALVFLLRYIAIWLLVILSPLAFFAIALPSTRRYFEAWWSMFWHWTLIGVVVPFFLFLGNQFAATFLGEGYISPPALGILTGPLQGLETFLKQYLIFLFLALYYWFALTTSISVSGIGSNAIVMTMKSLGGRAAGWVGDRAKGFAKQTAKETAASVGRSFLSTPTISGAINKLATSQDKSIFGQIGRTLGRTGLGWQSRLGGIAAEGMETNKAVKALIKQRRLDTISSMINDPLQSDERKIWIARTLSDEIGGAGTDQLAAYGIGRDFYKNMAILAAKKGDMNNFNAIVKNSPLLARDPDIWQHAFKPQAGLAADPRRIKLQKLYAGDVDMLIKNWQLKEQGKTHSASLAKTYSDLVSKMYFEESMRGLSPDDIARLDQESINDPDFQESFALLKGQAHLAKAEEVWGPTVLDSLNDAAGKIGSLELAQKHAEHWLRGPFTQRSDLYDPIPITDIDGKPFLENGQPAFFKDQKQAGEYIRYVNKRGPRPKWMGEAPAGAQYPPPSWTEGPGGIPLAPEPPGGPMPTPAMPIPEPQPIPTSSRGRGRPPKATAPKPTIPQPKIPADWINKGGIIQPPSPSTPPPPVTKFTDGTMAGGIPIAPAPAVALHPPTDWFNSIQRIDPNLAAGLTPEDQRIGFVAGGQVCYLNNKPLPYQIYNDPARGPRLRRLSPSAPPLIEITPNKTEHPVGAAAGTVILGGSKYRFNNQVYELRGNQFVPTTT